MTSLSRAKTRTPRASSVLCPSGSATQEISWSSSTRIVRRTSSESSRLGRPTAGKGWSMKEITPEPYRDIDFSQAKRGPVAKPEPGKTKISIRLDNAVIESFRTLADQAGGGNYQTLINDALVAYLHQRT